MRPLFMDLARELHAVEPARHLNVGEEHANVGSSGHDAERSVRVGGVYDLIAGFLQEVGRGKTKQLLVFHDEDHRLWVSFASHLSQRVAVSQVSFTTSWPTDRRQSRVGDCAS